VLGQAAANAKRSQATRDRAEIHPSIFAGNDAPAVIWTAREPAAGASRPECL
jgi:hypothetical protein